MEADIDCVVIGAGVVGLAVARAMALAGHEVIVLEAEPAIGMGTSSRNSEVIHAGLYYHRDSLKARHCVRGRAMLYDFCASRGVPHRKLGKLVVAHDETELPALEAIASHAMRNGVDDLRLVERRELARLEPALHTRAALHSPSTGIIDSHALMLSLLGEAEDNGAALALNTPMVSAQIRDGGIVIEAGGADPARLAARFIVNAAGLAAASVATRIDGLTTPPPATKYAKGNYFSLDRRAPFSHLVYPVPEPGGLGVHLTLDMTGRARFGPDVEWIETIDYTVDPRRAAPFYRAIRRYWPGLPDGSLHADYCGIRPKIAGQEAADFVIETDTPRVINLYGIESPGLTSCLSLADEIVTIVGDTLGGKTPRHRSMST
jgi:L-2-hydroxyglutarate oxidase LhgO